ncbi:MAG: DUF6089 family protein [Flammeovirgaceae bacterium]|jgi:hypothetical protein|nr:DUF6089 family protein [Flammeovirgaceae bacterium]
MGKVVGTIILLVSCSFLAKSQSFYAAKRQRSLILSGGVGTSTYYGDLANKSTYIKAEPNLNVGLQAFISDRIGARIELNWFKLAGDDKNADGGGRESRNLSFQSSNFELSAVGIVNLYRSGNRFYRRPGFNVYGFAGLGLLYFNPVAEDPSTGELVSLQPLMTEGVSYSLVSLSIPYGLGMRVKLTPQLNLAIEGGWRKLFTDYLDDVSTTYPGSAALTPEAFRLSDKRPGSSGAPGGIRGDSNNNDGYMLLNAKIEYYLPIDFDRSGNTKYSKKRKANNRYKNRGRSRRR